MSRQTVIPSAPPDELTFASFEPGGNRALVEAVEAIAEGRRPGTVLYLWGKGGVGKTHLLHACCAAAGALGRPFRYLNCGGLPDARDADVLPAAREPGCLVCLDDLRPPEHDGALELEWLSLYEEVRLAAGNLVVAASGPPGEIGLRTPDLVSRLSAGGVFHLATLDDAGKRRVLLKRSRERGFDMPEPVIEYIMRHHARDTGSLFSLLDRIDSASLSQHRRITIPFLRELLSGQG